MRKSVILLAALLVSCVSTAKESPKISEPTKQELTAAINACQALSNCLKEDLAVYSSEGPEKFACVRLDKSMAWPMSHVPYAFAACYIVRQKEPRPA